MFGILNLCRTSLKITSVSGAYLLKIKYHYYYNGRGPLLRIFLGLGARGVVMRGAVHGGMSREGVGENIILTMVCTPALPNIAGNFSSAPPPSPFGLGIHNLAASLVPSLSGIHISGIL